MVHRVDNTPAAWHPSYEEINHLWEAPLQADTRIEPVGVGLIQWAEDDGIPLIEIARREGQIIRLN